MYAGLQQTGDVAHIGLVATDASPTSYWWSIDWAMGHIDNMTVNAMQCETTIKQEEKKKKKEKKQK